MTQDQHLDRAQIVERFLHDTPEPQASDWAALMQVYPEHACYLADVHLMRRYVDTLAEEPAEPVDPQSVSRTMGRVLERLRGASDDEAVALERRLADLVGPPAREAAVAVGLKGSVSLFNGILAGRIVAPVVLLKRLAERLAISPSELALAFARRFETTGQPAFKSVSHKPMADLRPLSWGEAVRREHLPDSDERELLALMDGDDAF